MEKEKLFIKMDSLMKEISLMEKNMDMVYINGLIILSMKDYILMIKKMELENLSLLMEKSFKENGKMEKDKDQVQLLLLIKKLIFNGKMINHHKQKETYEKTQIKYIRENISNLTFKHFR